jgi:glycosyltransferase involved in cell wall biosynthesis
MKFKLIEYIHYPVEISVGLDKERDPYVTERYNHFPLNVYWESYLKLIRLVVRPNPFDSADVVLTNSKWTANVIRETYGEQPTVLNPPVPPNAIPSSNIPSFEERENNICMVGRFTEEKRYQWVIENVAPKVKNSSKIYFFGGAGTPVAIRYKNRLMSIATKMGLKVTDEIGKEADLYFLSDASRALINSTLDRSKIFLHATINEHWGISIAEALARGIPLAVHKSGGAWSDLAEEGRAGVGYTTSEEAIEAIRALISDSNLWNSLQREGLARVEQLSLGNFIEKLSQLAL